MKLLTTSLLAAIALAGSAWAQDADNTATNTRDRDESTLTPIDQSNDPADIKLVADIRKLVVGDDTLSVNGKNVKIITVSGVATLRGPVESQAEKTAIEKHATAAGAKSVTNQLEVKAPAATPAQP